MSTCFEKDRKILRELAHEYMQIASLDVQQKTIQNWKALHNLTPVKPMVMVEQICWEEFRSSNEFLHLKCEDKLAKTFETYLRKEIFQWKFFPGDRVVKPFFPVSKLRDGGGIGVEKKKSDNDENAETHLFDDQLPDEASLEKLHVPVIKYAKERTEKIKEIAESYFGDILPVRLQGATLWEAMWDRIVFYRGATTVLYDLIDEPEYTHKLMQKLTEIEHKVIDQLESENLLEARDVKCHCIETYCDGLPKSDYDPEHTRASDCWVAGAAQIFSEVSGQMHDEFEIEYMKPILDRFGYINYGCCEPLHNKIHLVKKMKNLRAISISPWADVRKSAEQIQNDYVMARKPNPSFLASTLMDEDAIRKDIRMTLDVCAENKTPVMLILKDLTTIKGDAKRLGRWCEIVNEEINSF